MKKRSLRFVALALLVGLASPLAAASSMAQSGQASGLWSNSAVLGGFPGPASGAISPKVAARSGAGPDAFHGVVGVADEAGSPLPVPAGPQVVTGYLGGPRSAILTWTGEEAIGASENAITLDGNGVYTITFGGGFFFDVTDGSVDPQANGSFALLVNGAPFFYCMTNKARFAYERPVAFTNPALPNYRRLTGCDATATVHVKGQGDMSGLPFVFPKGTTLQVALFPNDASFGELTAWSIELDVVRVGK